MQVVDAGAGDIHEVRIGRQGVESRLGPDLTADECEGVGEGREGLDLPS
jgi:hypothetical protein